MSSKARLVGNPHYTMIKERLDALRLLTKEMYKDGELSREEIRQLIRAVAFDAISIVKEADDIPVSERRQVFIDICGACWEDLGKPRKIVPDIGMCPDWFEKLIEEQVVDPLLGDIISMSAGVLFDIVFAP